MKKRNIIDIIEVPIDFLLLILSGLLAYFLRFRSFVVEYRPVLFDLPLLLYLKILLITSLFALLILFISGVYNLDRKRLQYKVSKIFTGCSTFVLILIIAFFFNQKFFNSRFIIIFFWVFSLFFLILERIVLEAIHHALVKNGYFSTKIIIIGNNNNTYRLISEFKRNKSLGYKIIEKYDALDDNTIFKLNQKSQETEIDEIILAEPYSDRKFVNKLVNFCNTHHIVYKYAASLLETKIINFEINAVAGIPLIEIKETFLDGWGRVWKRLFDIVLSFIGLIFFIPVYLTIGALIKLDTKGPVLVKLERIGAKNKPFKMYKFRSMIIGADKMKENLMKYNERDDGPLFKMKDDPRITPIGKFLRKTSIDELPQIINVLKGKMSLVGPRAHEPQEVAKYQDHHLKLLAIKPGITGMAQVSGRSDLEFEEEVKLDIYYIENWGLMLDLIIILKTIKVVLFNKSC